ncbi:hypothetical protein LI90_1959 [Carbonactinospora thermoautotrophica]|uniref:Uncharacterized protein n=1 Tax=Carbonactinospora thermoautotrophica TaxID=1469144 RepID=A0A132MSW1_9ACTN|nr:hypothetical protein LI90_1959 [Carbonactinospora thermoautotrophica]
MRRYWPPTSKNTSVILAERADPGRAHQHVEGVLTTGSRVS